MIMYNEKVKITANEYAKMIVQDRGESAECWGEFNDDIRAMTDKEIDDINKAVKKHQQRVWDFLGCAKIWNKIES